MPIPIPPIPPVPPSPGPPPLPRRVPWRLMLLSTLAMLAFAGNSLLCRVALRQAAIDPAAFTLVRLLAGAAMLALLVLAGSARARQRISPPSPVSLPAPLPAPRPTPLYALRYAGSWRAAIALFAYAACFSYAYVRLDAAVGALLLFGAVQATMISRGLRLGEKPSALQTGGYAAACAGVLAMLLPGVTAPSPSGAALMIVAGVAWGVYSLLGKHAGQPVLVNAGNFLRAALLAGLLAIGLSVLSATGLYADAAGLVYAALSGALTSALGYAIWYAALPMMSATSAAMLQLSVPVIAAFGGALWLGEEIGARHVLASMLVLGGVAVGILSKRK